MATDKQVTIRYVKMDANQGAYWIGDDILCVPIPPEHIDIEFDTDTEKLRELFH